MYDIILNIIEKLTSYSNIHFICFDKQPKYDENLIENSYLIMDYLITHNISDIIKFEIEETDLTRSLTAREVVDNTINHSKTFLKGTELEDKFNYLMFSLPYFKILEVSSSDFYSLRKIVNRSYNLNKILGSTSD